MFWHLFRNCRDMMTSSNENILRVSGPLCGEFTGHRWISRTKASFEVFVDLRLKHSVETPSTVDPQWNILYRGSKWNLHTVCWGAVGCEWGTTSAYFWITYVCFILSRHPVFTVEPQYQHRDSFIFVKSINWRTHTKSLKKSCWFKIWMGFVEQMLINLITSSILGFL